MPVNALVVRALLDPYHVYGNYFEVQCPRHDVTAARMG
jgi:hypothetical protein